MASWRCSLRASTLLPVAAVACGLGGCARHPAPVDPSERALFRDLDRIVTVADTTGWGSDRVRVDALLDTALDSVCRVDVLARRALMTWLDAEINRLGGPVEVAWRARGKDLGAVADLLRLTRVRLVLARAQEASADCPFWLEPDPPFIGRQISEHRWQLTFGGGGKASVLLQGGNHDLSFGVGGRLLVGRMFDGGDGIYTGAEVDATASFPKDATGMRTALQLGGDLVAPIVFRHTLTNAYFEFEAGWLGHATEQDWGAIDSGVHVGAAIGARALRARIVFPGAAFAIAWERSFLTGPDLTVIKVGLRAAFDLDL